jgi:hypothetical protein
MASIQSNSRDWSIQKTALARARGRRSAAALTIPARFLTDESVVADEFVASPTAAARRGAAPTGALDFNYELADGESAVLAIRHPSGALTFHLPIESMRRGGGEPGVVRFVLNIKSVDVETGRRGIVSKAINAAVIKVAKIPVDKVVSFALPILAAAFEKSAWKNHELEEGWLKVSKDSGIRLLFYTKRWARGPWHDLLQRIGADRELERPVVSAYEQEAGGCTGRKESHRDDRSGPLMLMRKRYCDQNADGLYDKTGPFHQTHRRLANKDALAACLESGFKRDHHLTLCDPLAWVARRQSESEL